MSGEELVFCEEGVQHNIGPESHREQSFRKPKVRSRCARAGFAGLVLQT